MPYLAQVDSCYPGDALTALTRSRRCCVGVSVGQPAFRGRRLRALMRWLRDHSESTLFLVGDHLLRHTIQIELGRDREDEASLRAGQRGRLQIHALTEAAQAEGVNAEIATISSLSSTPDFAKSLSWIRSLKHSNQSFSRSLQRTAERYLDAYRMQGRLITGTETDAIDLCGRYLEEELAAFSMIHESGWRIDVYPGPELPVLLDIAKGKYPDAPAFLKQRISVSLRVNRSMSALPRPLEASGAEHHAAL